MNAYECKERGLGCFRGLLIWIPIMLLLYALMVGIAFADEDYYYGVIKTKLVKVSDIDGSKIVPDVPFDLYSYYAVTEGACVTYSQNLKNAGKEILACVAVKIKDKEALKAWGGFIGETFDGVKITQTYTKHYPFTIADIKSYTDDEGTLIPYLGIDKDDPARFAMWEN